MCLTSRVEITERCRDVREVQKLLLLTPGGDPANVRGTARFFRICWDIRWNCSRYINYLSDAFRVDYTMNFGGGLRLSA